MVVITVMNVFQLMRAVPNGGDEVSTESLPETGSGTHQRRDRVGRGAIIVIAVREATAPVRVCTRPVRVPTGPMDVAGARRSQQGPPPTRA